MNCIKQFVIFLFLMLIRYASVDIKDGPESQNAMFT